MQSGGGDECPSLGHLAGHGRERERDICGGDIFGGGGENGSVWKLVENWRKLWFVEEGRELKEKEKGKEIRKEKIFSWKGK